MVDSVADLQAHKVRPLYDIDNTTNNTFFPSLFFIRLQNYNPINTK